MGRKRERLGQERAMKYLLEGYLDRYSYLIRDINHIGKLIDKGQFDDAYQCILDAINMWERIVRRGRNEGNG